MNIYILCDVISIFIINIMCDKDIFKKTKDNVLRYTLLIDLRKNIYILTFLSFLFS